MASAAPGIVLATPERHIDSFQWISTHSSGGIIIGFHPTNANATISIQNVQVASTST